jgi:two-component system phosphate regulon response regulator PhoB
MHTILIADDEAPLRALVRATLDTGRLRILEAVDGEEALTLTRTEQPDLILLDWSMPGRTGLDVARELRRDPATAEIPIVMLTARTTAFDHDAADAVGVDAYMTKPFSPRALLDLVRGRFGAESLLA